MVWLFPRTGFLRAGAGLRAAFGLAAGRFFSCTFPFANFFLEDELFLASLLLALPLDFACFFLDFFLVAIDAVYHRSAVAGTGASPCPKKKKGRKPVSSLAALLVRGCWGQGARTKPKFGRR